jgi:hypothetical protein
MLEWIKTIFSNWGLAKDAMSNPAETGGEVAESIIEKLNPALQRIVVLVLIIIALVMGANIGIEYEQAKLTATPPAQTETVKPLPGPEEGAYVNPNLLPAEPIRTVEVWKPDLEDVKLPEAPVNFTQPSRSTVKTALGAPEKAVQTKTRKPSVYHARSENRPVRSRQEPQKRDYYRVWQGLPARELRTSGPRGY